MTRKPSVISGHFDKEDFIGHKVKKRAEDLAWRELGSIDEWNQYIEQADGLVSWENHEKWQNEQGWRKADTYDYNNPDGRLLYQALRFEYTLLPTKKKFLLRHRVGEKWVHSTGPVRVPYNLSELIARPDDPIEFVEGEKAVKFLKQKGLLASCVQGQHWTAELVQFYARRTININLDNDDAGRLHTKTATEWLNKVEATIRVIHLPGLAPTNGLDDWLETHSLDEYQAIVVKTKLEPPTSSNIVAVPHGFPDEVTLPKWDFLYDKHLLRGTVSATAAMGATGKSSKSIVEALAMVTGKALLRVPVQRLVQVDPELFDPELLAKIKGEPAGGLSFDALDNLYQSMPLRVLLINLEDNREAVDKRIAAAMKHYKLTPEDVGGRLFTITKGELKFENRGAD